MSLQLQKTRPLDALQRVMTSFEHFEKKLDKLQDDVNFHGQTLHELRRMITNLAGGSILSPDGKFYDFRRSQRKTAAIQYENRVFVDESSKSKRKNGLQPLPPKIKAKSFQGQKGARVSQTESPIYVPSMKKYPSNTVGVVGKHSLRLNKAEAPCKVNTLRTQKSKDKKRLKIAE